jgi:hypothetical protein
MGAVIVQRIIRYSWAISRIPGIQQCPQLSVLYLGAILPLGYGANFPLWLTYGRFWRAVQSGSVAYPPPRLKIDLVLEPKSIANLGIKELTDATTEHSSYPAISTKTQLAPQFFGY